jgi:catechol 2,3-dioxygenase-like lactoylglutathione lyase family enzyme
VIREYLANLDRVGRLVAHGRLTEPVGDLLVLRASDLAEARRILRLDPYRNLEGTTYDILEWDPLAVGSGVNLEPPPARGAGRLTSLQRVAVVVRDQAAALVWYRDVLGLTVRVHEADTGYVELALGRGAAAVSLVEPRAEWGEPYYSEAMARIGRSTGVAFQTDSVLALEQRLLRAGARVTESPTQQPWGGAALRFVDPDGNEFLAFQDVADPRIPPARPRPTPLQAVPTVRWSRQPTKPKRL